MAFRILADGVLVLHLAFILFVIFGGLLVARWPRVAWLHLPAVAWGAWVEFAGWVCPLTPLENWLRRRGGLPGYASAFVEHYLLPLLYPATLTRGLQCALGAAALLINAAVYVLVLRHRAPR